MTARPACHHRSPRRHPRATVALIGLAVAIGLLVPTPARAAGVSAGTGSAERHRCPCGMDCGAVCCCKHKTSRKQPATDDRPAASSAGKLQSTPGPCFRTLPCGGAMPPGDSATMAVGEKATWSPSHTPRPASTTGRLAPPRSDAARSRIEVPTDEPPEHFVA